jgi:hypothetical protein
VVAALVGAWLERGRRVLYVAGREEPPPDWPGLRVTFVGEEALVTQVLRPGTSLSAEGTLIPIELTVYELLPSADRPASAIGP